MCVAREPDGKSFECSDYSSCRRKYDACGARVIFLKQNIFILLARHADGQLHSHTTFLQCSAASPLSLRWRSKRKTSPSYHVVRFAGNEFKRINKGEKKLENKFVILRYSTHHLIGVNRKQYYG